MTERPPWRRFLSELGRRKVWRIAAVYATTAFVTVQVADLTFVRLGLPGWSVTLVIALALVGFPIAVVLAWAFEVTPEGVRRTEVTSGSGTAAGSRLLRAETVFAVAAGVAVLAAGGWWLQGGGGEGVPPVDRVAVLPLTNLMNDPNQAYFVQGMHDGLISELQQAGVSVIARTSVMPYRDGETPARKIARELEVDALVEGTVLRAGDSVTIDARLVDPETEEYVWRRSFGGSLRNVVTLHRELTRAIADEIQAALDPEAEARLAEASPVDPEAYDAYLRGVFHSQRFTREDLATALEYFERAVRHDSTYAPAHAGIARVWLFRAQAGYVSNAEAQSKARPALDRARSLPGRLAEQPMVATGAGATWTAWDIEGGEEAFRQAIELNPRHPETRMFYGHLLTILGRWEEARKHVETAVELDPLNPFIRGLYGTQLHLTRRHEEAIRVLEDMFSQNPGAGFGRAALGGSYAAIGEIDEALRVQREAATSRGDGELARIFADSGGDLDPAERFRRAAEAMAARSGDGYRSPFRVAQLFMRAGDAEAAIEWLEEGVEVHDQNMPYMGVIPALEPLHDDPRFRELADRIGIPIVAKSTGS